MVTCAAPCLGQCHAVFSHLCATRVVHPHAQCTAAPPTLKASTCVFVQLAAPTLCYVKWYMPCCAPPRSAVYRGTPCFDGGFTRFIPLPPQTVGVRICCFPSKQLNPYYRSARVESWLMS